MNELKKEFEEKFVETSVVENKTIFTLYVRADLMADELWTWFSSHLSQARIEENEMWIKEIDSSKNILRGVGLDETSIHRKHFDNRIKELEEGENNEDN